MDGPDLEKLRAHYHQLSDEALAELHVAGPNAYVPQAWALLDVEFRTRGAAAHAAEEQLLTERVRDAPAGPPVESPIGAIDLVTVFASSNQAELTVAKLALEAGRIPFVAKGEGVQDLVGWGRLFGGLNLLTGPVQLQVRSQDADFALEVLEDLRRGADEPDGAPDEPGS